jgi:DNA-binding transcriptional MerR regulator
MTKNKLKNSGYSIGAVAKMTGLSTHILRMWERRYDAVVAEREANGRRIYSAGDVEKLSLLKILSDQGTAIGNIVHLDIDSLRRQAEEMDQIRHIPSIGEVKLAAFGEFLPSMFSTSYLEAHQFNLVVKGRNKRRFLADIAHQSPDVLLVETMSLDDESRDTISDLIKASGTRLCLVIYRYARHCDEETLLANSIRLLRAPVAPDELALAIRAAVVEEGWPKQTVSNRSSDTGIVSSKPGKPVPPRLYTETQLQQLASVESNVDCECPRQLSEVIRTVSAFEAYSRDCENRNEADAALHAHLHHASACAREILEKAMSHLAKAEGISI